MLGFSVSTLKTTSLLFASFPGYVVLLQKCTWRKAMSKATISQKQTLRQGSEWKSFIWLLILRTLKRLKEARQRKTSHGKVLWPSASHCGQWRGDAISPEISEYMPYNRPCRYLVPWEEPLAWLRVDWRWSPDNTCCKWAEVWYWINVNMQRALSYRFKVSLGYITSSTLSWVTVCNPVSKKKQMKT